MKIYSKTLWCFFGLVKVCVHSFHVTWNELFLIGQLQWLLRWWELNSLSLCTVSLFRFMGVDGVGTKRCARNVVNTERGLTPYSVVHAPPIPCIWTSNKVSYIQDDWLNISQAPPPNMKDEFFKNVGAVSPMLHISSNRISQIQDSWLTIIQAAPINMKIRTIKCENDSTHTSHLGL
jgi:hypothetical protein